ncbi:hypothetical protein AB0M28_17610 [Streptomyces sp. NPDC051940]|uniref:hypothetical protein n=1 Tax=Streptomyces sp. NPDC051940 TaxID=3155675 RepID=UPI003439CE09
MTEETWTYAHHRTLEGLLQRGRGAGARAALHSARAPELVYRCVEHDTRWWSFIDERAGYLAGLVRDLELDTAPIARMLEQPADPVDFEHAADVLRALGRIRYGQAEEQLLRYVHSGERWTYVLQGIAHDWPRERWDGLRDRALARLHADPGEHYLPLAEPWRTWAPPDTPPPEPRRTASPRRVAARPQGVAELIAGWRGLRASGHWCGYDRLADGLAVHGEAAREAIPLLRGYFLRSPHSYERESVLSALLAIAPTDSGAVLVDALWDCEPGVRLLAVRALEPTAEVRERLADLRDDPLEEAEARAAARARAAGTAPPDSRPGAR